MLMAGQCFFLYSGNDFSETYVSPFVVVGNSPQRSYWNRNGTMDVINVVWVNHVMYQPVFVGGNSRLGGESILSL